MSEMVRGVWAPSFFEAIVSAAARGPDERPRAPRVSPSTPVPETRAVAAIEPIAGTPSDVVLQAIADGSRDALSLLYKATFDELWHVAVLQTKSGDTALELVNDVFLWLWTHRDTLRPDSDIRVYLATAVRNRARNWARHGRVVQAVASSPPAEPLAMGQPATASDTEVERGEFLDAYHAAIATLTEQERLAIFLRWEEGWAYERIGQVLSLSKVGARKVVLRVQHKVQQLLAHHRE